MNLIDIAYKIPGPFDIIITNLSLIDLNNVIKLSKYFYNIKKYIIKNNFFYNEYKKINKIHLYDHVNNNNLNIIFTNNFKDNKKLNLILYKNNAISLEFYPNNLNLLTDTLINSNIEFIYNSKVNDIKGFKHFKYTNSIRYIEYVIQNKYLYVKNNIISEIFNKNFKHIDIIFNKVYIIVYYSYLLLYHIFNNNFKNIKLFYVHFYKNIKKINFNINQNNVFYILQTFKSKIDNICIVLESKININYVLFYKISLLYIYMIIEKKFAKDFKIILDCNNNKNLLIEKISILNIPKYLKHIIINKINII